MFKKGQSGNPNGRPKGTNAETTRLREAIRTVSAKNAKDFFEHFIERAYENDRVLIAAMKKLIPDRKHVEGQLGEEAMTAVSDLIRDVAAKRQKSVKS
jgi:hypothetical protein